MTMQTAVALLSRFYGFDIDRVMAMTLRLFNIMLNEMGTILNMEQGGDASEPIRESKPLSGNAGFALARQLLPKGDRRWH